MFFLHTFLFALIKLVVKNIDTDDIILIVVLGVIELFVIGFKAFNKDFTNRYGDKFEVGETYHAQGEIKWGNNGNGFHLCSNLEDCFRYFDSNDSIIAEVIGYGNIQKYDDEYYGYFDMYVCEYLRVIRVISREEIIEMMLHTYKDRRDRFIRDFNLTSDELKLFEGVGTYGQNSNQGSKRKQLKKY